MVGGKRLAIIARMDDSGLGHQTRDLVRLLNPDKVLAIDFTVFNGFKQHPEWYENYDTRYIKGFIQDDDVRWLMQEADIILTAETFYNNRFIDMTYPNGTITINQANYEFFEPLSNRSLLLPTKILMPSYWHLEDMQNLTSEGKVEYLPPPTFIDDYNDIREHNLNRTGKRRFLHVAGKMAAHDRAGTLDLIATMQHSSADFELVVKVQSGHMITTSDSRIVLDYSSPQDEKELYRDFDAMIQPRRYAGLNLPMNEALASGLPVIMTDISPNNRVLPREWLVPSNLKFAFNARTLIEVYSADHNLLGQCMDRFANLDDSTLNNYKKQAYDIAVREYSPQSVIEKWNVFINKLGV